MRRAPVTDPGQTHGVEIDTYGASDRDGVVALCAAEGWTTYAEDPPRCHRVLTAAGVTTVVIPRTGEASAARARIEHAETFVDTVKWRTGSEGRISHLKRDLAWRRTRLRGHAGAQTWCAHGVFAHNLIKLIQLQR